MKLDMDRLHKVANGELTGRGVGKTTLACYNVIGTLDTTEHHDVVCIIKFMRDIKYISRMLVDILEENGYTFRERKADGSIRLHDGRWITFIREDESDQKLCGYHGCYVDFVDY
jgi:hypothetical protein